MKFDNARRHGLKRYTRPTACAFVACVLGLTVAHASAARSAYVSRSSTTAGRGISIRVWDPFTKNDPQRIILQKIVGQWEKQTGNRVSLGGYASFNNIKMCNMAPEGHGPDLVAVQHDQLAALIACRAIQAIPPSIWSSSQQKQYITQAIEATRINGIQWAMPWTIRTYGLYYNTQLVSPSLFTSGSVRWSTLIARAKALTDPKGRRYGLVWTPGSFYYDYGFISGSGGSVFKFTKRGFDPRTLGVDSPGTVAGIKFIQDLTTSGKYKLLPGSMGGIKAQTLFAQGKAGMYISGPWDEDLFHHYKLHYGFAPLPAIGSQTSRPFSELQVFAVNRSSRHTSQAMSLLQFMTTHLQSAGIPRATGMPVMKHDLQLRMSGKDAMNAALARAVLTSQPVPNNPEMEQVWAPMNEAMSKVVNGESTPENAAHDAADSIRSAMKAKAK